MFAFSPYVTLPFAFKELVSAFFHAQPLAFLRHSGSSAFTTFKSSSELLAKAFDFDIWVQQVATDLECFESARRAAETKNS